MTADILCIGAVLWDIIGRSASHMRVGSDVPGRITRIPGGVALNIAMALKGFGFNPALLAAVGRDDEGDELIRAIERMGLICDPIYRSADLPTDRYMAIEGKNGLISAIADANSLEAVGNKILRPLADGSLASPDAPYTGTIALDGNLTVELLTEIAASPLFAAADLRVAPASPGKATRLTPLLNAGRATLYVNREEAGYLLKSDTTSAADAAQGLIKRGAARVLVTDGGSEAAYADAETCITQCPPEVLVTRVTGAGDTFMAAHITADRQGASPAEALDRALHAAAIYVSGETPL